MQKKTTGAKNIETEIWQLAEPIASANNCEVISVEYQKEGAEWILRIYLDRETPVDHDLCQVVSDALSAKLDENDPIKTPYMLEVSSPGIERPLKREEDFHRFAGSQIAVRLFSPLNGTREYQGTLIGIKDGQLTLDILPVKTTKEKSGKQEKQGEAKIPERLTIPHEQIAKANLVYDFNNQ